MRDNILYHAFKIPKRVVSHWALLCF